MAGADSATRVAWSGRFRIVVGSDPIHLFLQTVFGNPATGRRPNDPGANHGTDGALDDIRRRAAPRLVRGDSRTDRARSWMAYSDFRSGCRYRSRPYPKRVARRGCRPG